MASARGGQQAQGGAAKAITVPAFDLKDMKRKTDLARERRVRLLLDKIERGESLTKPELREIDAFRREGMAQKTHLCRTQGELAKALKVDVRTIRNYTRAGCPKTAEGYYDPVEVARWLQAKDQTGTGDVSDKSKADTRYRVAKAELAELELKKAIGAVISREERDEDLKKRVLVLKRGLLSFGRSIAPSLVAREPREIAALIDERMRDLIAQYAGQK